MSTPTGVHGGVMYCKRDHPLTESNRTWRFDKRRNAGFWQCKICETERQQRRRKPVEQKTIRNATNGEMCNEGHKIAEENAMWRKDSRRSDGGYFTCKKCFRVKARKRQAEYVARSKKAEAKRASHVGVRQIESQTAQTIVESSMGKEDAQMLVAQKAGLIAHARLRLIPTVEPATPEEFEAQFVRASDDIWKAVDRLMAAEKKNPLAHLNIKPDAERAWDRFNKALEQATLTGENVPNCQDRPGEFVDYDEEDLPTAEEAYRLCYGCPLLELCATYAEQERPAWGVHAQEVWVAGEIVNNE
jgi:hypothetical protein